MAQAKSCLPGAPSLSLDMSQRGVITQPHTHDLSYCTKRVLDAGLAYDAVDAWLSLLLVTTVSELSGDGPAIAAWQVA